MLPPIRNACPSWTRSSSAQPDGTFPNHEPNPLLPENREFIVSKTRAEGADLGVAYDGDADRCFFVDDMGEFVPGDFATALLAELMLEKEPGGEGHLRRPRQLGRPARDRGRRRRALVNRVGHAFIKHRMRKEDALFAGEVSAHYYFRDFTQADTGSCRSCWCSSSSRARPQAVGAARAVP